jgi:Zn finger protein HypA/HybF involved in hydrogenase expression
MKFRKYTKEQLIEAVQSSISIREVLIKLNVSAHGGNYSVIKSYIKNLNIDTSHFKGMGHSKGKNFGPKRPIEEYLSNKHKITSHKLRQRLIREEYFEHKCSCCQNVLWNNKPIPLELEHKDGNHYNNNLDNLTLLCPNCHAQTSTYRGKNISK